MLAVDSGDGTDRHDTVEVRQVSLFGVVWHITWVFHLFCMPSRDSCFTVVRMGRLWLSWTCNGISPTCGPSDIGAGSSSNWAPELLLLVHHPQSAVYRGVRVSVPKGGRHGGADWLGAVGHHHAQSDDDTAQRRYSEVWHRLCEGVWGDVRRTDNGRLRVLYSIVEQRRNRTLWVFVLRIRVLSCVTYEHI